MFNKSAKCHLVTYSEFVCLIHSESKQTQMLQFETEKVLFQRHARRQFVYAAPPHPAIPHKLELLKELQQSGHVWM